MKSVFRLLLVSVALIACTAQTIPKRSWDIRDGYGVFWDLIERETNELDYLTAEVDIRWKLDDQVDRASALLQLVGPDSMGVEVRGPFYSHLFSISLQADSLIVFGKAVGKPWKGAVDGPLLSRITGLHIENYDFSSLLLGRVTIVDAKLISERYLRADRASLTYENDFSRQIIALDLHNGIVLGERVEVPIGKLLFERKMKNYVRVGSVLLPRYVEIIQDGAIIELTFKNFETDEILTFNRYDPGVPDSEISRVLYP
ncbi:MAG: DUF4292 domain-containing protein [Candidatus Latescibacterota bacterium]|nr:DUF4292 domain-containing protein [Candidatus Latescibacterota bacterium]